MALTLNGSTNTIAGLAVGGLPDGVVDTDTLASSVNTIRSVDEWGIHTQVNTSSDNYQFTSNWESRDFTQAGKIGSAITESSGYFTFPSTGIWLVSYYTTGQDVNEGSPQYIGLKIYLTPNGGSDTNISNAYTATGGTNNQHFSIFNQVCVDISHIGDKVSLRAEVQGSTGVDFYGHGSAQYGTGMTFVRLGDT